jgi:hypothetical protein
MIRGIKSSRRHGSVLIYTIVLLPIFAGICLLAVDWARVQLAKSQLMRVADAAARYAVTGIGDGTTLTKANWVGGKNTAAGSTVVFQAADVETGVWASNTFTAGSTPANAVRVTARRTAATGNAVPLAFGFVIGASGSDVTARAVCSLRPYGYGVVGLNYVKMSGSSTISYSSATGATSSHGNIASNGDITLSGSAMIQGDARPGVGGSVNGAAGRVTGSTAPLTAALSYPPALASTYSSSNNNSQIPAANINGAGDVRVSSGNLTLPGGTYYVHDLIASGGSSLTFTGPATVCVTGDFTVSGGSQSYGNLPSNLKIVMVADPTNGKAGKATLSGGSPLYGTIYAPLSPVTISGGSQLYGSVVGLSIDASASSTIHYDLELGHDGSIYIVQ